MVSRGELGVGGVVQEKMFKIFFNWKIHEKNQQKPWKTGEFAEIWFYVFVVIREE